MVGILVDGMEHQGKLRSQIQALLSERRHSVSAPSLTSIAHNASSQADTNVLATSAGTDATAVTRLVGVEVPMTQEEANDYVEDAIDSERIPQLLPQPRTSPCRSTQIDDHGNEDESQHSTFSIIDHLRGGLQADRVSCEVHSGIGKFRVHDKFNCLTCVKIW